ncbi:unnamed protein product [Chondrus crispus]|uniref:Uncharacterized protein n=1 Tax=Chondrus crispus TaxID=2769 RepID=R7QM46_CHOCR|nr:unnamed protein product [Chondrus crispus]CDF39567.1 unnamed protein product [Chondrus crispus]|eukprot:XP_005709861.1 unnamed protein product [Chondrus crispus]
MPRLPVHRPLQHGCRQIHGHQHSDQQRPEKRRDARRDEEEDPGQRQPALRNHARHVDQALRPQQVSCHCHAQKHVGRLRAVPAPTSPPPPGHAGNQPVHDFGALCYPQLCPDEHVK